MFLISVYHLLMVLVMLHKILKLSLWPSQPHLLPRHFAQPLFIVVSKTSCTCLSTLILQMALQFSCFSLLLDKGDCSTDLFHGNGEKKELNNFRKNFSICQSHSVRALHFTVPRKYHPMHKKICVHFSNILIYYECIVYV